MPPARCGTVASIRGGGGAADSYANSRFAEVWTKLAVWGLTEFERVVFLDADMLVTRNMDELFSLDLADGAIGTCHACRCNPTGSQAIRRAGHPRPASTRTAGAATTSPNRTRRTTT
ncbi:glycosyltransferase [Arthrobacter sp. SX1312]|uniref:glycosyltransferase n=1 Tax=Arthrobacter sp. SX1312 TaxID=2058896 RepID=UPI0034D70682